MSETPAAVDATFFRVPLALLEPGELLPCDIWLPRRDADPVRWRDARLPFDEEHRARLEASGVRSVLIAFSDADAWNRHLEQRIGRIARRDDIDIDARATVLVASARTIVREVLEDPAAREAKRRIDTLAGALAEFTREPGGFAAVVRLFEHDYYTYTHSVHVAVYATALAAATGTEDPASLRAIARAAAMHDAGKVCVPSEVLNRRGPLDERDWELIRAHPAEGRRLLEQAGWSDPLLLETVELHHERMDGSGYPHGLSGEDIPHVSRIVMIADAYDAMTSDRAYKKALPGVRALEILRRDECARYDQELVTRFIRTLYDPREIAVRRR
ncbi:MAG: hypothetical protein Kow0062_26840 [Acidobacteriota bacterium]